MKIVVCNTEWASGQKQEKLNDIIFSFDPDIVRATEVKKDFFLQKILLIVFFCIFFIIVWSVLQRVLQG